MKKVKILSLAILSAIVVSCGTSNNVVSKGVFSKRKVNKGFFFNPAGKIKSSGGEDSQVKIEKKEKSTFAYTENTNVAEENFTTVSDVQTQDVASTQTDFVSTEIETRDEVRVNTNFTSETKSEKSQITKKSAVKQIKQDTKAIKKALKKQNKAGGDNLVLLYILCVLIPFVAVGLATDWDMKPVIFNLLWTLLCGIPGIIHAFIVVSRES